MKQYLKNCCRTFTFQSNRKGNYKFAQLQSIIPIIFTRNIYAHIGMYGSSASPLCLRRVRTAAWRWSGSRRLPRRRHQTWWWPRPCSPPAGGPQPVARPRPSSGSGWPPTCWCTRACSSGRRTPSSWRRGAGAATLHGLEREEESKWRRRRRFTGG